MASHRGSILGPLLFFLYSVDVIRIAANHGVCITHTPSLIICAYASCAATDQQTAERRLLLCIAVIHAWMSSNRLKLNADKTEFIWLGTRQQLSKVVATPLQVKDQLLQPTDAVRNLGVLIASPLTIEAHVRNVVRSCFYQLRQLRSIRRSLPTDARRTVAAAFIASRVDYSNCILYGLSQVIKSSHFASHPSTSDGPERCRPSGRRCWQIRTHHAGPSRRASLAASAKRIQFKAISAFDYIREQCLPTSTTSASQSPAYTPCSQKMRLA